MNLTTVRFKTMWLVEHLTSLPKNPIENLMAELKSGGVDCDCVSELELAIRWENGKYEEDNLRKQIGEAVLNCFGTQPDVAVSIDTVKESEKSVDDPVAKLDRMIAELEEESGNVARKGSGSNGDQAPDKEEGGKGEADDGSEQEDDGSEKEDDGLEKEDDGLEKEDGESGEEDDGAEESADGEEPVSAAKKRAEELKSELDRMLRIFEECQKEVFSDDGESGKGDQAPEDDDGGKSAEVEDYLQSGKSIFQKMFSPGKDDDDDDDDGENGSGSTDGEASEGADDEPPQPEKSDPLDHFPPSVRERFLEARALRKKERTEDFRNKTGVMIKTFTPKSLKNMVERSELRLEYELAEKSDRKEECVDLIFRLVAASMIDEISVAACGEAYNQLREMLGETLYDEKEAENAIVKAFENAPYAIAFAKYKADDQGGSDDRSDNSDNANSGTEVDNVKNNRGLVKRFLQAASLRNALNNRIFGQKHAVSAFSEGIFDIGIFSDLEKRNGPKGLFLFAGPPGVGKTYLAESAAKEIGLPFLRVDMSEYADHNATEEFNGVNPSYKAARPGAVTSFVDDHPECIVLFDEVEKANTQVLHLFLQILEGARIRDIFMDKEIDFSNVIVIMTTNAGKNLYEDPAKKNLSGVSAKTVIAALRTDINPQTQEPFFPLPIISRLANGSVIMFNHLEPFSLCNIVADALRSRISLIEDNYSVSFDIDYHTIATALLFGEGGASDARTLKGSVNSFVRKELLCLFDQYRREDAVEGIGKLKTIGVSVDFENADDEIKELFLGGSNKRILAFCGGETAERFSRLGGGRYEIVCTDDVQEAKRLLRGDFCCVLCDVACNVHEMEVVPTDLEDYNSDGATFFRHVREYEPDLSVYILDTQGLEEDRYLSFIREGACDVLSVADNGKLARMFEKLFESAVMAESALKLSRANRILTYNTLQTFSKDGTRADIILSSLALKHSVQAEDSELLLDAVSRPTDRFDSVIGAEDAKRTLGEFIGYLKNPARYLSKGIRPPRGVLLYGPPGTGKTKLAKAMAGESDVVFIQTNATEFFKSFVGEGPASVRRLFEVARKYAPAIIFIDEVDAIAKMRTGAGSDDSAAQLLNTMLSQLDGFTFDEKRPVFVLAATNYEVDESASSMRVLDPAFVRRFDRKIKIDLPNTKERERFIRYYLEKHGVTSVSDEAIRNLAVRSYGRSPADLEMVIEFAVRNAGEEELSDDVLLDALDAERHGEEKEWTEEVIRRTAVHEAGHTVIGWLNGEKPSFVTIVSRGGYGGYMMHEVDDARFGFSGQELLNDICCSMGGRAAEIVYYGEQDGLTTGASGDLRNATQRARAYLAAYGMGDTLASFSAGEFGPQVEALLFERVNEILKREYDRAVRLIGDNKPLVDAVSQALLDKNSLTGEEIDSLLTAAHEGGQS